MVQGNGNNAQDLADELINSPKKAQKEKHLWTIGNAFLIGSLTSTPHFPIHSQSYLSKILTWPQNCTTQNFLLSFHQPTKYVKILSYRHIKSYKIWTQVIFLTSPTAPLHTYPCTCKTMSRFKKDFPFHMSSPIYFPPRMPVDLNQECLSTVITPHTST